MNAQQTPKSCKCGTPFPLPIWRMRVEESPRFVSVCPRCRTEQPAEPDQAAHDRLRYQLVNDLLETDPPEDPTVEYATTKAEEPESVKAFRLMVEGTDDKSAASRIWYEFRYALKKQTQLGKAVSWQDIDSLIDAGMKRARKQLKTREMRLAVIGRFEVMKKRVQEFITDPSLDSGAKCEKCHLSKFVCPCLKE